MRLGNLSDWLNVEGSHSFVVAESVALTLEVVSTGASIFIVIGDERTVIYSGEGYTSVAFATDGPFTVSVEGHHAGAVTSLRWPRDRSLDAAWRHGDSFVQLEPKPVSVAPEIQAMMDNLQRNAAKREAMLRADFERKLEAVTKAKK